TAIGAKNGGGIRREWRGCGPRRGNGPAGKRPPGRSVRQERLQLVAALGGAAGKGGQHIVLARGVDRRADVVQVGNQLAETVHSVSSRSWSGTSVLQGPDERKRAISAVRTRRRCLQGG